MPLTYKEVAEIIKIIDASNLDELVIEMDGAKMHIRRNAAGGPAMALPASLSSTSAVSASKPVEPLAAEAPASAREQDHGIGSPAWRQRGGALADGRHILPGAVAQRPCRSSRWEARSSAATPFA